jgi:hypothetical protein
LIEPDAPLLVLALDDDDFLLLPHAVTPTARARAATAASRIRDLNGSPSSLSTDGREAPKAQRGVCYRPVAGV